ncbi:hypothetical protein SCLCIDRAFT_56409, partial [Scleroderma citrinum Foug A]
FVFDGPNQPMPKPGREVKAAPLLLVQCFQDMLTAFGFSWHVAPGSADAELAQLNLRGLVDVMVTDGEHVLLFGTVSVLRSKTSLPQAGMFEDMQIYTSDAIKHSVHLTQGGLVLMALMCSSDYNVGIPGCDVDVACQLACYGFGDSLLQAALMLPFLQFMEYIVNWCCNLCDALSTDPRGYQQQLHHGLTQVIQSELLQFPDLPAVALYASPLTLWS